MVEHNDKFIVPFCAQDGLNNLLDLVYKHLENADMLHNIITIIHCIMDCTVTAAQTQSQAIGIGQEDDDDAEITEINEDEDAMVLVNEMSVVENDDGLPLGYEIIASHERTIPTILDMV